MLKDQYKGYHTPFLRDNEYRTPFLTYDGGRYNRKLVEDVTYEFNCSITFLEDYIKKNELGNKEISTNLNDFKSSEIDSEKATYIDYLAFLCNKNKIVDNMHLYKELVDFMVYAEKNNLMHKAKKEYIEKYINSELFKTNKENAETINSDEYTQINYANYEYNNFRKSFGNEVLNKLASMGGGIYIDSDAKICLRFSPKTKFKSYSKTQAETLLSTKLGFKIKINEEEVEMYVDLNKDLLLLEKIKG